MTSCSGFGPDTKASEVADAFGSHIKGRIVAITGVSRGGLGGAAALAFAKCDPELLIVISRTPSKMAEVVSDIKRVRPTANVASVQIDLASQSSVRRAADEIKALAPRLDILVNNAGMVVWERTYSPDGIESQLAVNHLGPFLLTNLLKDRLVAAAAVAPFDGATRVVNVSSEAHRFSPFRFHDYNSEGWPVPPEEAGAIFAMPDVLRAPKNGYVGMQTYGHTKTATVLFTVALNRRWAGTGVASYSVHPGAIATGLTRSMDPTMQAQIDATMGDVKPKPSQEEGASTTLVAALDPTLNAVTDVYLDDCQVGKPEPYAVDPEKAERLWKLSEELVEQKF
ncbi:Short-chain dehydrogenase TIC 32 [Lasiodiplodia hormozganensis]|uniref:Short-chain dehydrogenase TIC 32 n=1 Tax=Lasiodiplodia hormozganensis TaxID=869390 RepID=A0AA40CI22_9PEZI|nr:Short-chain dehydrogenase TIC 32 [Lasiodiplodia hormozganensis]